MKVIEINFDRHQRKKNLKRTNFWWDFLSDKSSKSKSGTESLKLARSLAYIPTFPWRGIAYRPRMRAIWGPIARERGHMTSRIRSWRLLGGLSAPEWIEVSAQVSGIRLKLMILMDFEYPGTYGHSNLLVSLEISLIPDAKLEITCSVIVLLLPFWKG